MESMRRSSGDSSVNSIKGLPSNPILHRLGLEGPRKLSSPGKSGSNSKFKKLGEKGSMKLIKPSKKESSVFNVDYALKTLKTINEK
jgi:hypothetical protein